MEQIGAYSNQLTLRGQLTELQKCLQALPIRPTELAQAPKRRHKRRLETAEIDQIVAEYTSGASTHEIAKTHSISKSRVAGLLRDQDVKLRRQGLTAKQVSEAIQLYPAGRSLAWLAARYGVSPTTVARTLRRHGIALRPRLGSP